MDKYEILETIKHEMELSEDNNTFVVWLEEFIKEQLENPPITNFFD